MNFPSIENDTKKKISKISFIICLLAEIAFLILVIIAHYYANFSDFEWQQWELSELVFGGQTSKILFDVACIISGLILCFALLTVNWYIKSTKLQAVYSTLSISSGLSLFGVGAFPEDTFPYIHYILGVAFFVLTALFVLFLSLLSIFIFKMPKFVPIIGFLIFSVIIFHVATRWFFGKAISQRLAVFLFVIFVPSMFGLVIFNFNPVQEKLIK